MSDPADPSAGPTTPSAGVEPPAPLQGPPLAPGPTRATYLGLFVVALATLTFEILLTRIFSVTMWYHFAFMAVSVAMFGLSLGAIGVYLLPGWFARERVHAQMAASALAFAGLTVVALWGHLNATPNPGQLEGQALALAATYALMALPFLASGVCISLALTRFPAQVGRLYACDLAGAGAGCLLVIALLEVTTGPVAVLVVAALAGVAGACFAWGAGPRLRGVALACCLGLALLAGGEALLVALRRPAFRLPTSAGKGEVADQPIIYERWNSFSRVVIRGDPTRPSYPITWSLSPAFKPKTALPQLLLTIDGSAGTVLSAWTGDPRPLEHLRYDLTNLVHHLRTGGDALVVGAGGGRDVLSALLLGQRSVVAVEMNGAILAATNGRFGELTGHLDRDPRVTFVHDEARSWIARDGGRYDVLQISLVDTWAATAAGAFALSENGLYTVEAWATFLERLAPTGLLAVTRWHNEAEPAETYRALSLAAEALARRGVASPRDHVALVYCPNRDNWGLSSLLIGREPLAERDLARLEEVAARHRLQVLCSPRAAADPAFARLLSPERHAFVAEHRLNLSAPTDDAPFFFQLRRLTDLSQPPGEQITSPVIVLAVLLLTVSALTLACLLLPLLLTARDVPLRRAAPHLGYFAAIGAGFMLIEISQLQRLAVFLGHPSYALSVVLLSLLLACGLGSHLSARIADDELPARARRPLVALLVALLLFGALTPLLTAGLRGAPTPARIAVALAILAPLGLLLGMPFPLGLRLGSQHLPRLTPWLWGINGATSVLASVLAVVVSLGLGISATFWAGAACYGLALLAWAAAGRAAPGPGGAAGA